jgi:hypothetical protein
MTDKSLTTAETEEVKTCTTCGGTWPADRPICPACGASLTSIAAQPAAGAEDTAHFDWQWLDALAPKQDERAQASGEGKGKQAKGAWWQFWR